MVRKSVSGTTTMVSVSGEVILPEETLTVWFSIPYGYPLTNQKYYVMNADGLICPDNSI